MFPNASISRQILSIKSGLPVICGSSLIRSSHGKQTPGRALDCIQPGFAASWLRADWEAGSSDGGVAVGGL
jgi:hypothetical protein